MVERLRRWPERASRHAAWVAGVALLVTALAPARPGDAQSANERVHFRRIEVGSAWGPVRVLATFPRRSDRLEHPPRERYPVLVALHGRGESDPERGHLGWASRYGLAEGFVALLRGRVSNNDYRGLARDTHLDYVNESLRARQFVGLMVITPYVPDVTSEPIGSERMIALGEWLAGPLLETVRATWPGAARTREGTGIDGVSMGGRVALEAGLRHPEAFGVVAAMQPAIRGDEDALASLAEVASRTAPQRVRLLSSEGDPFLGPTQRLSAAMAARRQTHTLTVVPGPHDYAFNRGPGTLEMLLFHERALAREPFAE